MQTNIQGRLIVVKPDDIIDKLRNDENTNSAKSSSTQPTGWQNIALSTTSTLASLMIPGGSAVKSIVVGIAASSLVTEGIKSFTSEIKRKYKNSFDISHIKLCEAKGLTFPPSHPRNEILYIQHPLRPDVYYPAASFHRNVFEHKFSEAINLLTHLGVTEIKVEHICGWSKEFSGSFSFPSGAGKTEFTSGSNSSLLFEATYAGDINPVLPNNLVWYEHEPSWQSIANGRISSGLEEFSLAINYTDDFGINAELSVEAQKIKLGLGGKFQDHKETTWRISGKFPKP